MRKIEGILVAAICLAAASVQAAVVQEYTFNTDLEGWTANSRFLTYQQATASTGEGVAQMRLATSPTYDAQMLNSSTISLSAGQTWDTVEWRMRQLLDDGTGTAPSTTTQAAVFDLISLTIGGVTRTANIATAPQYYSTVTQADGWTVFTFDLATYAVDAGLPASGDLTSFRMDPIGGPTQAGKWTEIDYIKYTAIPEPATLGMVVSMAGALLFIRRLFMI